MALTLADLFATPDHYLHSFEGGDAIFVPMDRAAYARSIFLDGRISPAAAGSMRIPASALALPRQAPPTTAWVFHIAHCGSTLLAHALDALGPNLVLREPLALRQVAVSRDSARLALITTMLARRYDPAAPTIVKANVPVNFILADLAARDPAAPAILLHMRLDDYLAAILRSDNHREWLRRVTTQLAPSLGDVAALSDAERAAALWLAQMQAFDRALAAMPNARTLEAETFFARPEEALRAAARHCGMAADADRVAAIVAGPLFTRYSKNPDQAFDNAARLARRAAQADAIAPEVKAAETYVARTAGSSDPCRAAIDAAALIR